MPNAKWKKGSQVLVQHRDGSYMPATVCGHIMVRGTLLNEVILLSGVVVVVRDEQIIELMPGL